MAELASQLAEAQDELKLLAHRLHDQQVLGSEQAQQLQAARDSCIGLHCQLADVQARTADLQQQAQHSAEQSGKAGQQLSAAQQHAAAAQSKVSSRRPCCSCSCICFLCLPQ